MTRLPLALLLVPGLAVADDAPVVSKRTMRAVRRAHWDFSPYLDAKHGLRYIVYEPERHDARLLCGSAVDARLRKVARDLDVRMKYDTAEEMWRCANRPTPSCEFDGDHDSATITLQLVVVPGRGLVLDTVTELATTSDTRWWEKTVQPYVKQQADALREQTCP